MIIQCAGEEVKFTGILITVIEMKEFRTFDSTERSNFEPFQILNKKQIDFFKDR